MVRRPNPLRLLTAAALIGAAWRTAPCGQAEALAELRQVGAGAPQLLAQAAADAARYWRVRAGRDLIDVHRARTAAANLQALAVDEDGEPVEPSPPERNVTGGWRPRPLPPWVADRPVKPS